MNPTNHQPTNPPFSTGEGSPDVIAHNGRFFINMGRPGFNCRANNAQGFASKGQAARVIVQHTRSAA